MECWRRHHTPPTLGRALEPPAGGLQEEINVCADRSVDGSPVTTTHRHDHGGAQFSGEFENEIIAATKPFARQVEEPEGIGVQAVDPSLVEHQLRLELLPLAVEDLLQDFKVSFVIRALGKCDVQI